MYRTLFLSLVFLWGTMGSPTAQTLYQELPGIGDLFIASFSSAPFPHPKRENGYTYNGRLFPADQHYRDSSVAVFLPKGFRKTGAVDFVVYFHGWHNTIREALRQYRLAEQMQESNKNAVLVFPEGPCNAPDSFGGKLEETGGFRRLMTEVVNLLLHEKRISTNRIGRVVLAGHSGAYRVMAFILLHGGLTERVGEVYLFDALYGQTEKYMHWIEHSRGRMLVIYTEDGGTKGETLSLMEDLQAWKIPFGSGKEETITESDLQRHRLIFLQSSLTHDGVVAGNNQFRRFLQTGSLKNK
jgi:hypothetical protein